MRKFLLTVIFSLVIFQLTLGATIDPIGVDTSTGQAIRYITGDAVNGGSVPGSIVMWTTVTAPTGWVLCDGASLLRAGTYANLFAVIGTTFGAADGTHFNVPNLKGKFQVGLNPTDADFDTIGETGGAKTHTNVHTHGFTSNSTQFTLGAGVQVGTSTAAYSATTLAATVSGTTNNNSTVDIDHKPPYITLTYIIKY